ncbi:unnamed protein product [Phytomonas sp. EM1]|nr:unnamed protein product [Phytomonas sp. EM1]|eukprot:CCW64821.1 unnamed protein product [Phytomonas sp. isolate EM1]
MRRWISPLSAPVVAAGGVSRGVATRPPPYRRVGNVLLVSCVDHPFKHAWEVNRVMRGLRLEFMGQTTILPDIPPVRTALWRARAAVRVDVLDLDEAKALIGVPEHVTFRDLNAQIPSSFGRIGGMPNPHIRSKVRFMQLRRMRLRDVLHRDALEKRLLEEKRRLHAQKETPPETDGAERESSTGVESPEEHPPQSLKS